MKKNLLLVCGAVIVLSAGAQNNGAKYISKMPPRYISENPKQVSNSVAPAPVVMRKKPLVYTNTGITNIQLGCAANVLGGFTRPGRSILDYCPSINTLTMIHRSGPGAPCSDGTAGTGYYMFDVSKDGGTTWNSKPSLGPITDAGLYTGRYPAGIIYNPAGNTSPDNAFIAYHGASTQSNGSQWVGYHTGAAKISDPMNFHEQIDLFDSTVNFRGLIPDCMTIDNNGIAWISDVQDGPALDGTIEDTLLVRKGTWNATTKAYDYATTKVYFPTQIGFAESNIAFYGQTGYLTALANPDITFAPDSGLYISVMKSTDGGTTWGAPYMISMDVNAEMGTSGVTYAGGFQVDGAVDKNGKLHLNLVIAPSAGGGSINTLSGTFGQFAIITDGVTHTKTLLQKPQNFRGLYDATNKYTEDTRGQIAETMNGDKIFYVWFTTDTTTWPPVASNAGQDNIHPDAWVRMYDVTKGSFDDAKNLTVSSAADGLMSFGFVANWAAQGVCGAGSYQLHMGYQEMTSPTDGGLPVNFHYVGGACVTSVNNINNNVFGVANAYPNPTSGITTIEVELKQNSNLSIEVTDMLGQTVYSTSANNLSRGTHKFSLDASKFNSGIYFYTVKSKDFQVTQKLTRQ